MCLLVGLKLRRVPTERHASGPIDWSADVVCLPELVRPVNEVPECSVKTVHSLNRCAVHSVGDRLDGYVFCGVVPFSGESGDDFASDSALSAGCGWIGESTRNHGMGSLFWMSI